MEPSTKLQQPIMSSKDHRSSLKAEGECSANVLATKEGPDPRADVAKNQEGLP